MAGGPASSSAVGVAERGAPINTLNIDPVQQNRSGGTGFPTRLLAGPSTRIPPLMLTREMGRRVLMGPVRSGSNISINNKGLWLPKRDAAHRPLDTS